MIRIILKNNTVITYRDGHNWHIMNDRIRIVDLAGKILGTTPLSSTVDTGRGIIKTPRE